MEEVESSNLSRSTRYSYGKELSANFFADAIHIEGFGVIKAGERASHPHKRRIVIEIWKGRDTPTHELIPFERLLPFFECVRNIDIDVRLKLLGIFPVFRVIDSSLAHPGPMTFDHINRGSLWLEQKQGYIETFLQSYPFEAGDVMIVFSNGGLNAALIEAARYAKDRVEVFTQSWYLRNHR